MFMPAIIEVTDVHKNYHVGKVDVPALRGVTFNAERGEFVAILGPSGSGKSTMFYVLGGVDARGLGAGDDRWRRFYAALGRGTHQAAQIENRICVPEIQLLPTLDAKTNIEIAQDIAGKKGGIDREYFNRITELLGISKRLMHRPSELSGGEQQRVALARALINKPAIILADEPTGNLDTQNSEAVLNLLRHSNKELGQTVLMITHNPEAAEFADRSIHMRDGMIVDPAKEPRLHGKIS